MKTTMLKQLRAAVREDGGYITMDDLIEQARTDPDSMGRWMWDHCSSAAGGNYGRLATLCGSWPGWPQCQCSCCDHGAPATTTDDSGSPVCDACAEYTTDDDGNVICGNDPRTETVVESCGAGNQTRSYVRLRPPQMPETDEHGEYCLYWDTVGNDAHVVARFATQGEAEQAVEAKDWPRPGDHTKYLCGYGVRQLVGGEWQPVESTI